MAAALLPGGCTPLLATQGAFVGVPHGRRFATIASTMLFATKAVTVKLLPFDDKSELQVVVDLPSGTSLEATDRALATLADKLRDLPELSSIQSYAGTGGAIQFQWSGSPLLSAKRTPARGSADQPASQGEAASRQPRHRARRAPAAPAVPLPQGSMLKVVEVPPGPPVIATLLAEIYGR